MELDLYDRTWMQEIIGAFRCAPHNSLPPGHIETFKILCGLDVRTPFDEALVYGEKLLTILEVRDRLAK
jgi:hypothetical protein